MRFAHISDTHLGSRQYGLSEREEDFYHAFEQAVAKIIQERPDFVVHSGDLFDFNRPQPRALWVAQRCFSRLQEKGIPVYAITGNHDTLMRKGAMPPHMLFTKLNVRMITEEEPFFVHKGVFIGGSPYTSKYYSGRLRETLDIIAKKARNFKRSVMVLHQGIEKFLPHEFELKLEELPKGFDYYAMGHIHSRIIENFGRGKLAYPGSTELWNASEYQDYKSNGKGFYLVDLDGDEPAVQKVDLDLRREIIKEKISASSLERKLENLKAGLARLNIMPLLYLDVDSEGFERKALHERLTDQLSELSLSLRVSYRTAAEAQAAKILTRTFNIPEMIAEAVKDGKKARLATLLFKSLSEGDEEQALKGTEDFYSNIFPGREKPAGKSGGDSG